MATVGFTQIILHHNKGASAVGELWIYRGCIRGIATCGRLFKCPTETNRNCDFCSRDDAAIVDFRRTNTGETMKVVINSAYFPHEKKLLKYLVATNLEILNRSNEPPFQNVFSRKVLDLTLCSRNLVPEIVDGVQSLRVQMGYASSEPSLSDTGNVFRLANMRPGAIYKRNLRGSDLDSFRDDLSTGLCGFPKRHRTGSEMELCGLSTKSFNGQLREEMSRARLMEGPRRAWNRARNTGRPLDWNFYRRAQRPIGTLFCESMEEVSEASRLCRILARNPDSNLQASRMRTWFPVNDVWFIFWTPILQASGGALMSTLIVNPRLRAHGNWRGARADQWATHADSESLSCFGMTCCTSAKDFRPISLISFFLKMLEKLIEIYLKNVVLGIRCMEINKNGLFYRNDASFSGLPN
ncbi:hypothetical protein ACFW04_012273 [Cataglyphis niger]